MNHLSKAYWDDRYDNGETGWDAGGITTPLRTYFDQLEKKGQRILVPGAGNAYEVEYLVSCGFVDVHALDISNRAIGMLRQRMPAFPSTHLHTEDFFNHKGTYDLIVEQTFFCALPRALREAYVQKTHELLRTGGKLVGLLWNHEIAGDTPPFGGSEHEYRQLFEPYFNIDTMALAHNSIKPRGGRELFIKLIKR